MEERELAQIELFLDEYVQRYCASSALSPNIVSAFHLKREHTANVCQMALILAAKLGVSRSEFAVVKAAALLHDIGRFEQYARFQTFDDARSMNHAQFGGELLKREGVLVGLQEDDRTAIICAVENHNAIRLPAGLDRRDEVIAKIVRDADKIDIIRLSIESFSKPTTGLLLCDEGNTLSTEQRISAQAIKCLHSREYMPLVILETIYDEIVLYLSWISALYYRPSVEHIVERDYVNSMLSLFPEGPEKREVESTVRIILADRLNPPNRTHVLELSES